MLTRSLPTPPSSHVTSRADSVAALRSVTAAISSETGDAFFRALVDAVATVYRVRHVFVTECLGRPPDTIRMLAFHSDGAPAEPMSYPLDGTPCELVIRRTAAQMIERDVQSQFQGDEDLVTLEAESYLGVPLQGSEGRTLGHLALVDDRPMHSVDLGLFELLATRAAAELERSRAVERLAQSESRLRRVVDCLPHYVFAKDIDGRYVLANEAIAQSFGVESPEAMIGRTDAELGAEPDEAVAAAAIDRAVLQTDRPRTVPEQTVTDAAGRRRTMQIAKMPFAWTDGAARVVLGVATDVTEIRRAEERLRSVVEGTAATTGDAFFHSLVQHLAQALDVPYVILGALDGPTVGTRAVWIRDHFGDPFHYPLPGTPCDDVTTRGEQCFYERNVARDFPDSPVLQQLEVESYFGTPLFDFDGQVIGLLAVLDREPLEIDLQDQYLLSIFASRAAAELERQRIEEQSHQLQAQVLHVQKLESLGVLAGGIAHDFNNLLAGVMGNAGLLRIQLDDRSPLRPLVREIERAAERAAELANQMLAYSGKGRFVVDTHQLNDLVRDMDGLLASSISKKAALHLDLADDLPRIEADATQLRQVAMNLITNASDAVAASDRGGGTIRVRTRTEILDAPEHVAIYVGDPPAPGRYVVFEVEDDGVGMSQETQDRLFEPFFSTKRTGRGLGMAAVLGIVRGHRGAITVESTPEEGSVFRVYLPIEASASRADGPRALDASDARSAVERARPPGVAASRNASGTRAAAATTASDARLGTVLVVDDEEIVRNLARRVLERARFDVVEAEDGREALDRVETSPRSFDAILLDLTMPRLGGREVLRALRADGVEVPVVLTSGYTDLDELPELEEARTTFLKKPYRPLELEMTIAAALGVVRA